MKWWKVSKSSLVWFIEERDRHDNKNVQLPARRSSPVSLASLLADNKSSCGESRDGMGLGKVAIIPHPTSLIEGFIYALVHNDNKMVTQFCRSLTRFFFSYQNINFLLSTKIKIL